MPPFFITIVVDCITYYAYTVCTQRRYYYVDVVGYTFRLA